MEVRNEKKIILEKKDEDEDEEDSLYHFFVCEEYVEKTWNFQTVPQQTILCSKMSTTDHDLTGQIVWPASVILAWFIDKNYEIFQNKSVLELGAGCGLGGLLASHFASSTILTDGNDIVLRLLEKNKQHLQLNNCFVDKLLWGINSEVMKIQSKFQQFPDYIIGADIILWPNQLKSLLCTIRWLLFGRYYELLQANTTVSFIPKAFISYVVRANTTSDLLFSLIDSMGFVIHAIDNSSFIPSDCKTFDHMTFHLFEVSLSEETLLKGCDIANEKQHDLEEQMSSSYLPC